ncbi:MAG: type II toxin-antitoxin system RelE/ParE family toxin [Candidatus Hydrogenedentes bacterium]|nr:type II toxin-antitoxin system RelE/ParE family toxin [Candidatus Hydrogenedentota bacterium]
MASFEIRFKESVAKDLRSIPNTDVKRFLKRVQALSKDPCPMGSEKLSAQQQYRVRQGVYRIVSEVRDGELLVIVVKIGHRREVYRRS